MARAPHRLSMLAAGAACAVAGAARAGYVDAGLEEVLRAAGAGSDRIPVLVHFVDRVDVDALAVPGDRRATHERVVRALRERAEAGQGAVGAQLDALQRAGIVEGARSLWLAHAVSARATPDAIRLLAARRDVEAVFFDPPIVGIVPVGVEPAGAAGGVSDGLEVIKAPAAWALGFRGQGILVASLDTGVDGAHPALASRWAGVASPAYVGHPEWAWFDPLHLDDSFPYDLESHGTHTMGTVCGGPPGDSIGVAPDATWISAAPIDRIDIPTTVSDIIESLQWIIDPDGDPATSWDVPDVCSNSWGLSTIFGYPACDDLFWSFLDACEAADVVMVFAAGNDGSLGLTRPADRATDEYRTLAVAAVDTTDPDWPIAPFSSLGPSFCTPDGTAAIKPDIAGPGIAVRSAVPGGTYAFVNGTSVAAPHVSGVAALIRQACPDLTVDEVKQVLFDTAVDLGDVGEDNTFGHGLIDAVAAIVRARELCGPSPPHAEDVFVQTGIETPVLVTLVAFDPDGAPQPLRYRITSLPGPEGELTDPADGTVITPLDLPYELADGGNVVRCTPRAGFYGTQTFTYVADDLGNPPGGGPSEPATVSVLVAFAPPVITSSALPPGYVDFAYGQVALEADLGQPPLEWSVANAFEYGEDSLGQQVFEETGVGQGWHDDDAVWSLPLPFAFPYYGETYDEVWVSSNGLLDFTAADDDWSNSTAELIAATRIAVIWDDLRTDSGDGSDIYVDTTVAEQVTIRWQAVTYDTEAPVNASCTLLADGTVRLDYGEGNAPLTPTVGLSAGVDDHFTLASFDGAPSLAFAPTLLFAPPAPLPEGMTLSAQGVLGGVPLEAGSFGPRFRVTDALGRVDERTIELVINAEGRPGDITGPGGAPDGVVNALDMLLLLSQWGDCPGCSADLTFDGTVDALDLLLLISAWGP